ncbi:hypothetical protein, partial [Bacteroides sp. 51]|uniref:hypothetical protein n=1 Tax=Bacteroides sp. 51 TaxID=2302938 RepID=UPI0013D2A1BB
MKCISVHRKKGCRDKDEFNFPDDMPLDARLEILMADYKSSRNSFKDKYFFDEIRKFPSLEEAIIFAAGAVSSTCGKHPHQHRISCSTLLAYGYNLIQYTGNINLAKSFDELRFCPLKAHFFRCGMKAFFKPFICFFGLVCIGL